MLEFAQNMKRGLSDSVRRTGMKAAGGTLGAVASGFLLAALWSFLATDLDWGSTYASLAVAGLLLLIAIILFLAARRPRHTMPTGDDLKRELQARVSLAKDAAVAQAKDRIDSVIQPLRDTAIRAGATPERAERAKAGVERGAEQVGAATQTNLGSMGKLIGAFAVGITLASAVRGRGDDDEEDEYYDDIV